MSHDRIERANHANGFRCLECGKVSWMGSRDTRRAARPRCHHCGSIHLAYEATVKAGRSKSKTNLDPVNVTGPHPEAARPRKRRRTLREKLAAGHITEAQFHAACAKHIKALREDYLVRKKHGLLKPELRRKP